MTDTLALDDEVAVHAAVGALEIAEGPVAEHAARALTDPALRKVVESRLHACGRQLIAAGPGEWVSGYRDDIADILAQQGIGVLRPTDRAVLALVLLRTVAIPRSRGRVSGESWVTDASARPTTMDELAHNRHLTKTQIRASLRRLRTCGLIRPGHRAPILPGPALHRLTQRRSATLWEDLVLLCAPASAYADALRRRRAASDSPAATGDPGPDAAHRGPPEQEVAE